MIPEPAWKPGLNFLTAWFCPFGECRTYVCHFTCRPSSCTLQLPESGFVPAAQRTWIALEEKGIPYTLQEVALKDPATGQWRQFHEKPEWFLRRNPLGDALHRVFAEHIGTLK
jgi:hypothetical protein